jgi:hypothetical protein
MPPSTQPNANGYDRRAIISTTMTTMLTAAIAIAA